MKKLVVVISFLAISVAQTASAAVLLNEIAWMGSANSSSDEWMELYNTGSTSADLTGWKITGKGGATIALLSGSIAPNTYFLIERSDDNTVPNISADLVVSFGKGISNDGETLKLIDGGGNTVDSAAGGKNWTKLGGDKVSKQTAQRTSSGWITAIPTPKAANKTPSLATEIAPPLKAVPPNSVVSSRKSTQTTKPQGKVQHQPAESETSAVSKQNQMASTTVGANVLWQRGKDAEAEKHAWQWMIVAITLTTVASVMILRANVYEPTEADKYAIIEDIIESREDDDRLSDY